MDEAAVEFEIFSEPSQAALDFHNMEVLEGHANIRPFGLLIVYIWVVYDQLKIGPRGLRGSGVLPLLQCKVRRLELSAIFSVRKTVP